jgi:hypothetical protein
VSYGWQGNLSQLHCVPSDLQTVDDNFAKLAAKGVSIMISSGDSGSGYSTSNSQCNKLSGGGSSGSALVGDVLKKGDVRDVNECCEIAGSAPGWTFTPASTLSEGAPFKFSFKNSPFHTIKEGDLKKNPAFVSRDVDMLTGDVDGTGGKVTVHNANGTFADAVITFGPPTERERRGELVSNISATFKGTAYTGRAIFLATTTPICFEIDWKLGKGGWESGKLAAIWQSGGNPLPPPPPGSCTVYKTVTSHKTAPKSTISGSPANQGQGRPLALLARLIPLGHLRRRHPLRRPEGWQRRDGH